MKTIYNSVLIALFFILLSSHAFAGPNDLISMDGCGTFTTGGGHCFYNTDYQQLQDDEITLDFDVDFDKPFTVMDDGNGEITYVVSLLTVMSISNFMSYTNACVDGVTTSAIHAIDLLVDGEKVGDNYSVSGADNCFGGGVTFSGTQGPIQFLFSEPGLHKVELIIAAQNNGTCGQVVDKFSVIVVHPVFAINGSSSQNISFSKDDVDKTFYITWTISNLGTSIGTLEGISATGCGAGFECSFPGFGPLDVNPNETIVVIEEVKATKPGSIATPVPVHEFGVKINYTDIFKASDLYKEGHQAIEVSLLWAEQERFHVELFGGVENYCIGKDGTLGGTGPGEVPHVLFDWSWSSIGINEPGKNSCDRETMGDLDFIYCDPTQFSIELLKRLNMIYNFSQSGDFDKAANLETFQAYLIGDNINEDFRKDFDNYYSTTEFFGDEWYNAQDSRWDLYFTDEERLIFNPSEIDSGLYLVQIEFDFESDSYRFFYEGDELASTINVTLTKIRDPLVPNPLYQMPFNGEVGLHRVDSDGLIERKGYGLGFQGDELRVDEFRTGSFIVTKGDGEKTVQTSLIQDFGQSNVTERGLVLSISKDASSIVFSPSYATPLIMEIDASDSRADGYYSVRDVTSSIASPMPFMGLWTGFGSTPMVCANFDESALYYRMHDSLAVDVPGIVSSPANPFYGFTWEDIPVSNRQGKVFLETVFYTPSDVGYTLRGENTTLMSPSGKGQAVSLNYKGMSPIIENVFALVRDEYVCVSFEDDSVDFWWNPQRLIQDLDDIKILELNSAWLENCSVEGNVR